MSRIKPASLLIGAIALNGCDQLQRAAMETERGS